MRAIQQSRAYPGNVFLRPLTSKLIEQRRSSAGTTLAALPQQHSYPPKRAPSPDGVRHKRQRLNPVPYRPAARFDSGLSVQQSAAGHNSNLQELQTFLGYQFKSEQLLAQACTHSADKQALSYRQLAFVGDATLWMLFSEHAFHTFGAAEDPTSGAWPAHMSALLSRANCAATARQWGLQHYLQHCSSSSSSEHSSSSSSRSTGMYNGSWSSDTLAEMFEGVLGALLLDSNYATVQQLLQPWVAAAFDASRAAAAAAATRSPGQPGIQLSSSSSTNNSTSATWLQQQHLAVLLHHQLQQHCGYTFINNSIIHTCSKHVLQLLLYGTSDSQAEQWHFLGYSLLQFAAAQHAYQQQCQQTGAGAGPLQQQQQQQRWQQQQQWGWPWWQQHFILGQPNPADLTTTSTTCCSTSVGSDAAPSSSSSSSEGSSCLFAELNGFVAPGTSSASDVSSSSSSSGISPSSSNSSSRGGGPGSTSSSSSSSVNQVQLMSKQMEKLTTIRHRCKMWLQLGLDPAAVCPPCSYVLSSKWKLQKAVLSRCLDILLAAVYLDGGMPAVMHVLDVLLILTPPTGLDKSWIPGWAQRHGEWKLQQQQQQQQLRQ